jgi:hypothetical protein
VSKTESFSESYTTSVVIGGHGEPAGNYRYALYAVCDVYFVISTSLDNQNLLSWDTVVCARSNTYNPHWDYSTSIFDNSPEGNTITFDEDFYKNLPKPSNTEPTENNPAIITTEFKTIRTDTIKITDAGRLKQHIDVVNFNTFDMNINTLKQKGYKTVSFYIQLNVKEDYGANQYLYLFNSPIASNDYLVAELKFTHSVGIRDTNWWVHYENELKFENIPLDKFPNKNEFVLRYDASGKGKDTWENKDLKIKLIVKQ